MYYPKDRIASIDIFKGLLVVLMILDHSAKILSPNGGFTTNLVTWIGDLSVFPGLLLSFGFITQRRYFSLPKKIPLNRIILTIAKIIAAYYLSAIAFRILIDDVSITLDFLLGILIFSDIPSYSEFLIAFGVTLALATIFIHPLQAIMNYPSAFIILLTVLLLNSIFPYELITSPQIGLLFGSRELTLFPVMQYSVFFLIGMYFAEQGYKSDIWFILSLIGLFSFVVFRIFIGLPSRFPPSPIWLLGSFSFVYTLFLIANHLDKVSWSLDWIKFYGRHVLASLLISNMILFYILSISFQWPVQPWFFVMGPLLVLLLTGLFSPRIISALRKSS
jgi:hypothetical protein